MDNGKHAYNSKKAVIEALNKAHGIVSNAAVYLGIEPHSLYNRIRENPDLQDARDEARNQGDEEILDAAESNYFEAVKAGNLRASWFILTQRGASRGYGNKLTVESHNVNENIDLTKLTDEELEELEKLVSKSSNQDSSRE